MEKVCRALEGFGSPYVLMMVGVPGSGKSYVAEQLSAMLNLSVLSSDKFREELSGDANDQSVSREAWQLVYDRAALALQRGDSVIVDGRHNALVGRRRDTSRYLQSGAKAVIAVWVDTPLGTSLERNRSRSRVVPEEVIERMQNNIDRTPPSLSDGFATVFRLDGR